MSFLENNSPINSLNFKQLHFDDIEEYQEYIYENNEGNYKKNYQKQFVFIVVHETQKDGTIIGNEYYAIVTEKTEDEITFKTLESRSIKNSIYNNWREISSANTYAGNANRPVVVGYTEGKTLKYTREQIDEELADENTELRIYDSEKLYENANNVNKANQSAGTRRRRQRSRRAAIRRHKTRKAYRRRR